MPSLETTQEGFFPPCRTACPAGVNVQAYIALASRGKFQEALELIRKYIPLPAVCGRVCFSPCEDACTRKNLDEALSIRDIKRLVADQELKMSGREKPNPLPKKHNEKVAVIGSGPAGLAAGYELVKMGYPVTVFEKAAAAGGMLRECLPEYRLPRSVLDTEIQYLKDLGLSIQTHMALGNEITIEDLFNQGFKVVFLAIGAQKCLTLNCEGENLGGVLHSLDFLKKVNSGENPTLGSRVAVIGGGNVALDVARTAKRLGSSEVTIVYRRSEEEMPAHHREVEEAKLEGIKLLFLTAPKRFIGENGKLTSIEYVKMSLGPPDETGRRRPITVEGSEFTVPIDNAILAIGETADPSTLPKEIELTSKSIVAVDPITYETKMRGVFAGGDAVTGPASVIEAIAAGKEAAVSIDRYIRGIDLKLGRERKITETSWVTGEKSLEKKPRQPMPCLGYDQRSGNFQEVELGFSTETGMREAHRCLFCGPCAQCLEMENLCESDDVLVDADKCIGCANCEKVCLYGAIRVETSVAKVNQTLCKGCGTCAVECPAMVISMTNLSNERILNSIRDAQRKESGDAPRVLAFVCNWTHNRDVAQLKEYPNARVIPVKCAGRVDPLHVLQAFWMGIDGVLIVGCAEHDCHHVFGAGTAERRVRETKKWLSAVGIESSRLLMEKASAGQERGLDEMISSFQLVLKEMGINPLQKPVQTS